jgi:hypothetical protein
MKRFLGFGVIFYSSVLLAAQASSPPQAPPNTSAPVPYSSLSQVNLLLSQLEQTSQSMQRDLAGLRIDKWKKTDADTKRGSQADVASIQRNLQTALPEIIAELRNSPDSLGSTFKLYRNLDALYDVFSSLAESTGAFGSGDEYQSLRNDLSSLENSRRMFADRMATLAESKEAELTKLRTDLQSLRATDKPATELKKVVVDDTEPPKKPVKKKPAPKAPKPPAGTTPSAQTPPPATPTNPAPQ